MSVDDPYVHVYSKCDLVWAVSEMDPATCWIKAQIVHFSPRSYKDLHLVCAYVRKFGGDRNQLMIKKFSELRPRDSEACAPSYDLVHSQFQDLTVVVASHTEQSVYCLFPCDPAGLNEFMVEWVRAHSAQRCNDDGGLGLRKPEKVKSRCRASKEKKGKTAREQRRLQP